MNKTYNRSQYALFLPIMITIAALIIGLFITIFNPTPAYAQSESVCVYETIEIEKDDTLWGIASEHMSAGQDIRSYIIEIRSLNQLTSDTIYEGQHLIIPVYKAWYEVE